MGKDFDKIEFDDEMPAFGKSVANKNRFITKAKFLMNHKTINFLGITAIVFACCYIYHEVYPHIAGQVLISF